MSCTLTFLDHHRNPDMRITEEPNVRAVSAAIESDLSEEIRTSLREPFDHIITEENVDGLMAAAIALIHQGGRGEVHAVHLRHRFVRHHDVKCVW